MKTNEIYKAFIKLNDTQKVAIIEKIKGLQWLAALSSDKLKDRVLTELYAEEAFKAVAGGA